MTEENGKTEAGGGSSPRSAEHLAVFIGRLGIDSALIGIPKLARVLGMGASTLYAYIRAGTFFLPYRMINGTPMVKIDDLIDWYKAAEFDISPPKNAHWGCSDASLISAPRIGVKSVKRGRPGKIVDHITRTIHFDADDVKSQAAADQAVDGIVASVMARMDRQRSALREDAFKSIPGE